ncbi:MAG: hypothetical protein AB7O88_20925 [Reyranellaceae bacterium]
MAGDYQQRGFRVLRGGLIAPLRESLKQVAAPLLDRARAGNWRETDGESEGSTGWYGHKPVDTVMEFLAPMIAHASGGGALWPTFSYLRLYPRGTRLAPHTDRDSCEVAITAAVDGSDATPWPILIEAGDGGIESVDLAPGDILVYAGRERRHWREPLEGDWRLQVMFFYVRQAGPFARWKYDTRPALGTPPPGAHPDIGEAAP